jgi:hypothetical protein
MKKLLFILSTVLFFVTETTAQMGVNSTGVAPNPSAMLDISSTSKGLLIPRMTTAQKNAISPKPVGLMVFDTNINGFQYWLGNGWTGTEWTTYGNDIINYNTGNVGIGTGALPINKLQIGFATSPAFVGNDFAIGSPTGGGMSLFQSGAASTGNSIWYSNSSFALMPAFAGTGNVGINLTNPTSRLEVFQTGKTQAGFGTYVSPMRLGIGVTGSHAIVGDNYDAVGVAGFGANASASKKNIGVFGTTGTSGNQNIGVMAYQNGNFTGGVFGSYNDVKQTGSGEATASYNKVANSTNSTSYGVYSEVNNTLASGSVTSAGVTSVLTSASGNTTAANYGYYGNVTGSGTNYGLFVSASGGLQNYSIAAYGNSFFEDNVAIGTTSIPALPLAKLVVTGFKGTSSGTSSFFNPGSAIYTNVSSGSNNSIYATHGIVSGLYIGAALAVIASDNRIKNIKGISNSAEDLEGLKKIQITDYTMKDVATWGNKTFKKVIAQQVEEIYPEVIKLQTSVIPDIYALAESVVYDAQNKKLSISLLKDYEIKIGERIELVHPEKGKIIAEVMAVSGKKFTVKNWEYATDKIFVFGREVNDFRSVDYEALSMLGISAIQQLAKEVEELKKQNANFQNLKERLEAIEASLRPVQSGK